MSNLYPSGRLAVIAVLLANASYCNALSGFVSNGVPQASSTKPNAIVIGAGLSGLAVSLGLVQSGWTVDLVEKRYEFVERGATFGLRPNGLRALQELCAPGDDITTQLSASSVPTPQGGFMLPWGSVRDALLERVRRNGDSIRLHMGWDMCDIVDDPTATTVQAIFQPSQRDENIPAEANDDANSLELHGCCVLGCDGVGSAVRQHLQLPPAQGAGVTMWRGSLVVPDNDRSPVAPLLTQGITPLGLRMLGPYALMAFNFHDAIPNTLAWTVSIKRDAATMAPGTLWSLLEPHVADATDRTVIHELLSLSHPDDQTRVLQLRTINPSDVNEAGRWGGRGRVTLLADAAHAMRPATGVGGALAFEDCVVLCRHIQAAAASGADSTTLDATTMANILQAFEAERLPRVTTIWNREWEVSESAYSKSGQQEFSQEYNDFVNAGV